MDSNDVIYISLLLLSVLLGHVIKHLNQPMHRLLFSGVIGFLMALFICGYQIWHSLFVSTVILLISKFMRKRVCHIVGFAFGFGYLLFFRTASWFGLENPLPHTNAIQLILTLKA
jgi:lysophospholipid acyltransferase 7